MYFVKYPSAQKIFGGRFWLQIERFSELLEPQSSPSAP